MAIEDEVIEANERFYRAFASCDAEAMEDLWAKNHSVACIHPGWEILSGRERVLSGWQAIFENSSPAGVTAAREEVVLYGELALLTCLERFPEVDATLAATNLFLKEGDSWVLVHHQSGPVRMPTTMASSALSDSNDEEDDDEPPILN